MTLAAGREREREIHRACVDAAINATTTFEPVAVYLMNNPLHP